MSVKDGLSHYEEYFNSGHVERLSIPYEGVSLPVLHVNAVGEKKDTILLHGGNDSYFEEFFFPMLYFAENGFEVYLFEGPDQGGVLLEQGKHFTYQWEKPVKVVLDTLELENVTIIGVSLGGMLVPRAAAFDKRISRVIGWSVFLNFLSAALYDVLKLLRGMMKWMIIHNFKCIINFTLKKIMKREHKNDETDKEYFKCCASAFLEDTCVDFKILISLLEYLQLEIVEKPFVKEVYPNIFEAPEDELVNDFIELFNEPQKGDLENAKDALGFITLDFDKLKFLNGKVHGILPIWDREKRDNRFDVKPIIMQEGKCIFSPVVIKQLATLWKSSFLEWYLPFEIGLENVKTVIAKWKKRYEDEMVQDIASEFREKRFNPVLPEIELASRYPYRDFPDELGDYDVIAVNQSKKEIWLIESKVLQKVGSIYEDQMQQKSFFYKHKYDEKFQRRIDYVLDNLCKVISVLELEAVDYTVIPYMVTNKLFASRYKKLDFPIISYHELMRKLEDY